MSARAVFLVAVALVLAGCQTPRTEVLLVISTDALTVPRDLDALDIQLTDTALVGPDRMLFGQRVPLCVPPQTPMDHCFVLPLTVTLVPGPRRPNDPVRVEVDAQRGTINVIQDSATFTFRDGASERLDFVLYGNCRGTNCAASESACISDGTCKKIDPVPFQGEPDLAAPAPGADLAVGDLAGVDLAGADFAGVDFSGVDLAQLPDLSSTDLAPPPEGCGSVLFGGATAAAVAPAIPAYNPPGSFTAEAWVFVSSALTNPAVVVAHGPPGGMSSWSLGLDSTGHATFYVSSDGTIGNAATATSAPALPLRQWVHLAGVFRASTDVTVWVDGAQSGATTAGFSAAHSTMVSLTIGNSDVPYTLPFPGYLDEVRVSTVARYTASFAPLTRFVPPIDAMTVALFHADDPAGTTLADSSASNNSASLFNSASLAVVCVPRLCGALHLDGAGGASTTGSALYDLTAPFTIEGWFKPEYAATGWPSLTNLVSHSSAGGGLSWALQAASGQPQLVLTCPASAVFTALSPAGVMPTGVWTHLAGTFDSGMTMRLFVNGQQVRQIAASCAAPAMLTNAPLTIGLADTFGSAYLGFVDEVRVEAAAFYSSGFTPATQLPSDANTLSLYHLDDGSGLTAHDSGTAAHDATVGAAAGGFVSGCF